MQPVNYKSFILYVQNLMLTNGANCFYRKMVRRVDADYISGRGKLQLQQEMRVDTDHISGRGRSQLQEEMRADTDHITGRGRLQLQEEMGVDELHIRPRCITLQEGILPVRLKPHDCISLISTNYQIMCPESLLSSRKHERRQEDPARMYPGLTPHLYRVGLPQF